MEFFVLRIENYIWALGDCFFFHCNAEEMNPHHLLLLGLALCLVDVLEDVEAHPTISNNNFETFATAIDDVDMTLLNRALRQQGNDCDAQVAYFMLPIFDLITTILFNCPTKRDFSINSAPLVVVIMKHR